MSQSDQTLYLVILISLVSLVALLLLDYRIHRRRLSIIKISSARAEPSRAAPVPLVTVPEPAPLPPLQPLSFNDVFRRSLRDYRANLILVVPLLIRAIQSVVSREISLAYPTNRSVGLLNDLATGVVLFVVVLVEISMTEAVVRRGKTTLRDWPVGFRYFWTVIGLVLVFGLLLGLPVVVSVVLVYGFYEGTGAAVGTMTRYVASSLLIAPIAALGQSALSVCLAAVVLDSKRVAESLRMGWRAILARRSAFSELVIFMTIVTLCFDAFTNPSSTSPMTYDIVTFAGLWFGPLWSLIAFRIYWGFDRCVQCGTQVPVGSKFCPNCGIEQEH